MKWYLTALKNYSNFSGRARRKEYWMFILFNMIFSLVAFILDLVLGLTIAEIGYGPIYGLYALAILIPSLAVAVRRLHDIGKSGWTLALVILPVVGAVWLIVLMLKDSEEENEYGRNPKKDEGGNTIDQGFDSEKIIWWVALWIFGTKAFFSLLSQVLSSMDIYNMVWYEPVIILSKFVWGFIPLSLAFTIRDTSRRKALLVTGILYLIYEWYEIVMMIYN